MIPAITRIAARTHNNVAVAPVNAKSANMLVPPSRRYSCVVLSTEGAVPAGCSIQTVRVCTRAIPGMKRGTTGGGQFMAGERDRTEGEWDKAKGTVKEAAGKATNDRDLEAEGRRDQAKGGAEKAVGKVKEAVEDVKEGIDDPTS